MPAAKKSKVVEAAIEKEAPIVIRSTDMEGEVRIASKAQRDAHGDRQTYRSPDRLRDEQAEAQCPPPLSPFHAQIVETVMKVAREAFQLHKLEKVRRGDKFQVTCPSLTPFCLA